MQILDYIQSESKVKRISLEIMEKHVSPKSLLLFGINQSGYKFAQCLQKELKRLSGKEISCHRLSLNPAQPLESDPEVIPPCTIDAKHIIIVDDVANTGRTLFFALKPLMQHMPKSVQVAVLVDRKHKSFPIKIDYVGLSLATTLQNNIRVSIEDEGIKAFLE